MRIRKRSRYAAIFNNTTPPPPEYPIPGITTLQALKQLGNQVYRTMPRAQPITSHFCRALLHVFRRRCGGSLRAWTCGQPAPVCSSCWVGPDKHRPISVYHFPCRALTLCARLCMGIEAGARFPGARFPGARFPGARFPGARFPARSADALPATLYGHFT